MFWICVRSSWHKRRSPLQPRDPANKRILACHRTNIQFYCNIVLPKPIYHMCECAWVRVCVCLCVWPIAVRPGSAVSHTIGCAVIEIADRAHTRGIGVGGGCGRYFLHSFILCMNILIVVAVCVAALCAYMGYVERHTYGSWSDVMAGSRINKHSGLLFQEPKNRPHQIGSILGETCRSDLCSTFKHSTS